jgi:hypothetical protein
MASIFIAHGKATGDGLLDLYANRQFRKQFKCQQRIWKKLKQVLVGEFPEPKQHKPTSHRLEDALKKRILKLSKQGYKQSRIVEMTNTPLTTVRRIVAVNANAIDTTSDDQ